MYSLGTSQRVDVPEEESNIVIQGIQVAAKVEAEGLRLSQTSTVSTLADRHTEAVAHAHNLLSHRREDLTHVTAQLQELLQEMDAEEDENAADALFVEYKQQKAVKKNHEREIARLEAQLTVSVAHQVTTKEIFRVIRAGVFEQVDFFPDAICWCPHLESKSFERVEERVTEMPMTQSCGAQSAASGQGLLGFVLGKENTFKITAHDRTGQVMTSGGDTFQVDTKEVQLKVSVVDNKNGTYSVAYTMDKDFDKTQVDIAVTLNGSHIAGSPFRVKKKKPVIPGGSYSTRSIGWNFASPSKANLEEMVRVGSHLLLLDYDAKSQGRISWVFKVSGNSSWGIGLTSDTSSGRVAQGWANTGLGGHHELERFPSSCHKCKIKLILDVPQGQLALYSADKCTSPIVQKSFDLEGSTLAIMGYRRTTVEFY